MWKILFICSCLVFRGSPGFGQDPVGKPVGKSLRKSTPKSSVLVVAGAAFNGNEEMAQSKYSLVGLYTKVKISPKRFFALDLSMYQSYHGISGSNWGILPDNKIKLINVARWQSAVILPFLKFDWDEKMELLIPWKDKLKSPEEKIKYVSFVKNEIGLGVRAGLDYYQYPVHGFVDMDAIGTRYDTTFSDGLNIATNFRTLYGAAGIFADFANYPAATNSSKTRNLAFYADFLFAPAVSLDKLVFGNSIFKIRSTDRAVSKGRIGFRSGFEWNAYIVRGFGLHFHVETGFYPHVANYGFISSGANYQLGAGFLFGN